MRPYITADLDMGVIRSINGEIGNEIAFIYPMITLPTMSDRNVLSQGMVNNTIYGLRDRLNNSPFAQQDWFARPQWSFDCPEPGLDERGNTDKDIYNLSRALVDPSFVGSQSSGIGI